MLVTRNLKPAIIYVIAKTFSSQVLFQSENHNIFCVFVARKLNHSQSSILKRFDCTFLTMSNEEKEHRYVWKVNK